MPEYSSTTITPADGVQVPSMNGSTSGNFLLSALKSYILAEKGQANGLASLGSDGKLTAAQLPDLADDVIVVASYAVLPAAGTAGKIYITADNNKLYRWDPDLTTPDYVELSVDLSAYATKAELAEEESAREAADSNLKSAIQANSKRITNLETKAGDEIPVTYPSPTYGMDGVPASVAPYGKGRELIGVSRVTNQLASRFASDYWEVYDGSVVSPSFSDGVITATITSVASSNYRQAIRIKSSYRPSIISGHFYLLCYDIYSSVTSNYRSEIIPSYTGMFSVTGGQWTSFQAVTSAPSDSPASGSLIYPHSILAVNDYYKCRNYILTDLNQYFGTSDLSFLGATDSDKLATIQTNYPELLIPSDYDTGTIVSTTYSALKSVGVNLLDNSIFDSTSNFLIIITTQMLFSSSLIRSIMSEVFLLVLRRVDCMVFYYALTMDSVLVQLYYILIMERQHHRQ